jgi:hypothetical protein
MVPLLTQKCRKVLNQTSATLENPRNERLWMTFVRLFVDLVHGMCREPRLLVRLACELFDEYRGPVISGEVSNTDVSALFCRMQPLFRERIPKFFKRTATPIVDDTRPLSPLRVLHRQSGSIAIPAAVPKVDSIASIPLQTRYLMVASFLAGHNPPLLDAQYFGSSNAKKRRKRTNVKPRIVRIFPLSVSYTCPSL